MANQDWPHGFIPVGSIDGSNSPGYIRPYTKASGYGEPLGKYDPVVIAASGVDVERYTAAATIVGVNFTYAAASIASTHDVMILNESSIIEGQTDGSLVAADTGLNANFITSADCNATTGISIAEIDAATEATTSTLDLHLLRLAPYVGNAAGTNSRWFCVPNNLRFVNKVVGI